MKSLLKLKDKLNRCLTIKAHPENFKLQRDQAFSKVFFFNYYPVQMFAIFSDNKNFRMIIAAVFSCT